MTLSHFLTLLSDCQSRLTKPNSPPTVIGIPITSETNLLAFLAQQMLDLNKQRQAAVEDFLLDLEGVLSPAELQKTHVGADPCVFPFRIEILSPAGVDTRVCPYKE